MSPRPLPAAVRAGAELTVARILREIDDVDAWFLFDAIGHRIMCADYPNVIVTRKGRVKCPHCGAKTRPSTSAYFDRDDTPWRERDWSTRDNLVTLFKFDSGELGMTVDQDSADHHTLAFVCQSCALPVGVPSDIEVQFG